MLIIAEDNPYCVINENETIFRISLSTPINTLKNRAIFRISRPINKLYPTFNTEKHKDEAMQNVLMKKKSQQIF